MGDASPLVGRTSERHDAYEALQDPAQRIVALAGPAGIGKSALARAVAPPERGTDATVVWSRCWNGAGTSPLWPWQQLLDQLGVRALNDVGRNDDRFLQFDAIARSLAAAARGHDLTLVIDDLHWADPASLQLLTFIVRDARCDAVKLLVTLRELEGSTGEAAPLLDELAREITVVPLSGLDRSELGDLLGPFADLTGPTIDLLHTHSGGNPFFALEMARHHRTNSGDITVSRGIRAVIDNHIDMAEPEVRGLLALAAAQGDRFDPRVLAAAEPRDIAEVQELLHLAQRVGLVRCADDGWYFDHALIGETLVAAQSPLDLARHHLATAEGIEKVHGPDDEHAGLVTNHLLAAGSLVPPERLAATARRAASEAARRLAWEDQSRHLGTVAEALRTLDTATPADITDVLVEHIDVEKRLGAVDRAHELGLQAASLARSAGDAILLARVALAFPPDSEGIEIDDLSNPEQLPLREEALETLAGADELLDARLRAATAMSLYWETPTGDRAESHRLSEQRRLDLTEVALATARRHNDRPTLALALNAHLHANWGPGLREQRVGLAEELVAVARELGDHDLALKGRVWQVADLLERGEFAAADREITAFEREAERIRSRLHLWTVARWRSNLALMDGDLDACERLAEQAMALGVELMPPEVAFHFYATTLGPVQYLRQTLVDSIPYLEETAAASPNVPAWQVGLATAYAEAGQIDDARALLRGLAADDFGVLPRDLNFMGSMMMLALIVHHVRDADIAEQIYDHLLPLEGRFAIHGSGYTSYGTGDIGLGQAADAAGHPDRARRHFERAIEQLADTGSPYRAVALHQLADIEQRTDPNRAAPLFREAAEIYTAPGLTGRAAEAESAVAAITDAQTVVFAESGRKWRLERGDQCHELAALKGFRAVRELVSHPGVDLHVLDLAAAIEGHPAVASAAPQERIDPEARAAYKQRIRDIGAEMERADERGDRGRSRKLSEELDAIAVELSAATGLGGRSAQVTSDADRARVNVTKHIKRAIDRIASVDSELGAHLTATTSTGMVCAYRPAAGDPNWRTIAR